MSGELSYGLRAQSVLNREEFRFTHRLGQNFLLDDKVVDEIAAHARVEEGDAVLEIGSGAGTLTAALLRRGAHVLAVELDRELEAVLNTLLGAEKNFRLIFGDIMRADLSELRAELAGMCASGGHLRVAANLPYYITSDLLSRFALSAVQFDSLTVMVQSEAADRIMARLGQKQYCLLTAQLQWRYSAQRVMELPRAMFTPPPHVDSSLIRFEPLPAAPAEVYDQAMLFRTMAAAFRMRRKTMLNNLCSSFALSRAEAGKALELAGLEANVRGEALTQAQLADLSNVIFNMLSEGR